MIIAVNTRFLIKDKLEGIGRFTAEALKRMVISHPEHQFIFFFDREPAPEFIFASNVTPVKLFPPARHPFLFIWFFEWSIPRALKKYKADVFLSCDGFMSLRTKVPSVGVIHDLAFEHYAQDVGLLQRWYYKIFFPAFARKARRIATVSEFSKADIIKRYGIDPSRIDVVYNAASEVFKPVSPAEAGLIKQQYSKGADFFSYVGALQPRKNIRNLLLAFDQFKANDQKNIKLLVIGRKAWKTRDIESTYNSMQYRQDVIFTGRVSDQALSQILASSLALVYIPYLEGFGIPIVEAMNCGVPVITSNITAMPEVAGEAGILIDPMNIEEVASSMTKIAADPQLRENLAGKGAIQRLKFTWDKTADFLWKCLVDSTKHN